ncbi:MAG TPA: MFS transporter [Steroidobacteraceae bacterium]|nr:MFS transporter [Steroidobacteraceae bacterium]
MTAEPASLPALAARRRPRIRWRIFALLFGFGLMAYVQQRSLTVASYQMMPQLQLSQMQIGWLEWAFLLGYAALQFPGGVLGQRLGARATFVLIGLIAFAATVALPLSPLILAGTGLFVALLGSQLLLGLAQGPIFPVQAGVIEAWFRPDQWSFVQGTISLGLGLGAAVTPPVVAWLMTSFGWQRAVAWTTLPSLALIALWAWYARNTPVQHPSVSPEELAEVDARPPASDPSISWQRLSSLLKSRDLLALTLSYLCMNYVYYLIGNWCFLYLVQERHFTVLEGGWLTSTPALAAAAGAGIGGKLGSFFGVRYGARRGFHIIPFASLPAAGLLLLIAVHAANAYLAVAVLALCFALVELNEGPYWAAVMHLARGDTMSASGLLNTGGNVGGLVATPIVAYLSGQHSWTLAFAIGTAFAFLSAAAWLLVDPTRHLASCQAAAG